MRKQIMFLLPAILLLTVLASCQTRTSCEQSGGVWDVTTGTCNTGGGGGNVANVPTRVTGTFQLAIPVSQFSMDGINNAVNSDRGRPSQSTHVNEEGDGYCDFHVAYPTPIKEVLYTPIAINRGGGWSLIAGFIQTDNTTQYEAFMSKSLAYAIASENKIPVTVTIKTSSGEIECYILKGIMRNKPGANSSGFGTTGKFESSGERYFLEASFSM